MPHARDCYAERGDPRSRREIAHEDHDAHLSGMTALDFMGPAQVWAYWPGAEVQTVWKTIEPIETTRAVYLPNTDLGAFEQPDVIFVPGGTAATFALMGDEEVLGFCKRRSPAPRITSVCTGVLVLGAAGLLDGRRPRTGRRSRCSTFGAEIVRDRWVIDGNRATGVVSRPERLRPRAHRGGRR